MGDEGENSFWPQAVLYFCSEGVPNKGEILVSVIHSLTRAEGSVVNTAARCVFELGMLRKVPCQGTFKR